MSGCDRLPELLRLRDEGRTTDVGAHVAECPECAAAWRDLEALTALGQALPSGVPDARRRESVRTELLARAAQQRPRRTVWMRGVALAAAAALMAVVGWQLLGDRAAPTTLARVESDAGAVFSVRHTDGDEVVELTEGRVVVQVTALKPGQRFRVLTGDAEVEVRGTTFAVQAAGGRLQAVEVVEGLVEVRPRGEAAVVLAADERWTAGRTAAGGEAPVVQQPVAVAEPTLDPAPAEPVIPAPPVEPVPVQPPPARPKPPVAKPTPAPTAPKPAEAAQPKPAEPAAPDEPKPADAAPTPPSPQTLRFEAGWSALRAGEADAAAEAFAAAAALAGPLEQDAVWWRAVALGRAGRDGDARVVLKRYRADWPGSARAAEAAVMLGWIEFEAGRVDGAEALFRAGLASTRAPVKASAEEGLAAVAKWRAEQ